MIAAQFRNRADAGRALARALERQRGPSNVVVLALPRGGVPVALEVALSLGVVTGENGALAASVLHRPALPVAEKDRLAKWQGVAGATLMPSTPLRRRRRRVASSLISHNIHYAT